MEIIIIFVILFFAYMWKKSRQKVDVHFVDMSDPNCLNITNFRNHSERCKIENCKAKLQAQIIECIKAANKSIDIAMYNLTNRKIIDSIQEAGNRGVRIRIIVDQSMVTQENTDNYLFSKLPHSRGISIKMAGGEENQRKKLMHHKFCLIDTNDWLLNGKVITGSFNWTYGGLNQNSENVFFIESDEIQRKFNKNFNSMWENRDTVWRTPLRAFNYVIYN
ncbi:mitochondrial cardiolipin hydrolase-like [Contarinia nasturtii]|uniref:mitochondrial cardiolipin hydrolase-like n=1 Tax=Contarinia nasturtii TaxID=265458 RepID=UPI0012D3AF27|nr:mitochondrial cardiolipin hydrolase-like [Contarinia nasturtii]